MSEAYEVRSAAQPAGGPRSRRADGPVRAAAAQPQLQRLQRTLWEVLCLPVCSSTPHTPPPSRAAALRMLYAFFRPLYIQPLCT